MATAVCLAFLVCGVVAITLHKSPRELLIPALLGIATFAVTGPFVGVTAKCSRRIRICAAVGGIAIGGFFGQLTILYSALRLRLIQVETFDGLLVTAAVCLPFLVLISYFMIRWRFKGKKELV